MLAPMWIVSILAILAFVFGAWVLTFIAAVVTSGPIAIVAVGAVVLFACLALALQPRRPTV
jgi:multidrug transporter EmrE-like cation transporter